LLRKKAIAIAKPSNTKIVNGALTFPSTLREGEDEVELEVLSAESQLPYLTTHHKQRITTKAIEIFKISSLLTEKVAYWVYGIAPGADFLHETWAFAA
jgi:hypothetical protein